MGQRSNFQNAPIELKIVRYDPYDLLSMLKIQLRSLKVTKGVIRGQRSNYQNSPIELEIVRNDPYDLLSMLKIQLRSLKVTKGDDQGSKVKLSKFAN